MGRGVGIGKDSASVLFNEHGKPLDTDAFHRLRAWSPLALHDNYHKYEIASRTWGTTLAGSGSITHLPNESAARLTVTAADGDRSLLRTHTHFRYQAGRGIGTLFTGYHSDDDAQLSIVRRSYTSGSAVDVATPVADWNRDRVDGSPNCAFTLDLTKGNIFGIDLAWLGVGNVMFHINGVIVHEMENAGMYAMPYMRTPVLPMSFEIINVGALQYRRWGLFNDKDGVFFQTVHTRHAASITSICSSVWSDGGEDNSHRYSFAAAGGIIQPGITTQLPLIAIRPALTYNSITNRTIVFPHQVSVLNEIRASSIRVYMNPTTLTGGTWVTAGSLSAVEYNATATAVGGGDLLAARFAQLDSDAIVDLGDLFTLLGRHMRLDHTGAVQDTVVVTGLCEGTGAQTSGMRAVLSWMESR